MRIKKFTAPMMAGAAIFAVAASSTPASAASNDNGGSWPKGVFAPYVDTGVQSRTNLATMKQTVKTPYFTLASVTDQGNCNVGWASGEALDVTRLKGQVSDLRNAGGDVAVSVGGPKGTDPAASCTTASALQAQYQRIVDTYSLTHLDLNVTAAQLGDTAATQRRDTAVAALERANPNLNVSYTLPTGSNGITDQGKNLLKDAQSKGVKIGIVNALAGDYGQPVDDMGAAAITAGNSVKTAVQEAFPGTSDSDAWSMVGVTPKIGVNASAGEKFTTDDATKVTSWAKEKHIGRLSFWTVNRDTGGCSGATTVADNCSGVAQATGDFSNIFSGFTG